MKAVLDASALLAYLQDEPGGHAVEAVLAESAISSVNWAEVIQKSVAAGVEVGGLRSDLTALGLTVAAFTPEEAEIAGELWQQTRAYGLSLADRACLSLGIKLNIPVMTTDRAWKKLRVGITVTIVR